MNIIKIAAVDIGSNAMRLLINNVIEQDNKSPQFIKTALVRIPIRLGHDVFSTNQISDEKTKDLIKALKAYKLLIDLYHINTYRICATSAMREAKNAKEVLSRVYEHTQMKIEIIDGVEEAKIISTNKLNIFSKADTYYLYVDVGGGSTEMTLYFGNKAISYKTFKIGTIRLLSKKCDPNVWNDISLWIKGLPITEKIMLVGSGGNINKVLKLSGQKASKPLEYSYFVDFYNQLKQLSYEEKISLYNLNEDRADVITHAMKIYLHAMKVSKATRIFIPKIGLSDGIIKNLYNKISSKSHF